MADRGDASPDLHISGIGQQCAFFIFGEREGAFAIDKTRATGAADLHAIALVYHNVAEGDLTFEAALHRPNLDIHRRLIVIVADALKLIATGERAA